MSLKRYDSVGWEEMDESPTGQFVYLEDIIKLLEEHEDNWRCRESCCEAFGWDGDNPINQLTLLTTLIKRLESNAGDK